MIRLAEHSAIFGRQGLSPLGFVEPVENEPRGCVRRAGCRIRVPPRTQDSSPPAGRARPRALWRCGYGEGAMEAAATVAISSRTRAAALLSARRFSEGA